MPKKSKIRRPTAQTRPPEDAPLLRPTVSQFACSWCGKVYKIQQRNFPASQSPLYRGNGGYLTMCGSCAEGLLEHYTEKLGSKSEGMQRVCMKLDLYWSPELFESVTKASGVNHVRSYIGKLNLSKYIGKTYDDTIDEQLVFQAKAMAANATNEDGEPVEVDMDEPPSAEMIAFWGVGFTPDWYYELQARYDRWTAKLPQPIEEGAQSLYRQICMLEVSIARNTAAGKSTSQDANTLNTLIGSVNQRPSQKRDEAEEDFDALPFGVGIRMCENTRPIPKPLPELEDVDNLVRYISIWFLGHLCRLLNIRNTYCKLYEDEIARLKVERPELADEDDESVFNDIFGDSVTS